MLFYFALKTKCKCLSWYVLPAYMGGFGVRYRALDAACLVVGRISGGFVFVVFGGDSLVFIVFLHIKFLTGGLTLHALASRAR